MDAAKVELLRALGQTVRGLSGLFWGLPAAIFICVQTARTDWLAFLGDTAFLPSVAAGAQLYYSLRQLRAFQKQERIWQQAITRAEFLAILVTGLAPFLFWWHRFSGIQFFAVCVGIFVFASLFFLIQINHVMRRLCAMLPDEALRLEASMFTSLNTGLFLAAAAALAIYLTLSQARLVPRLLHQAVVGDNPQGHFIFSFLALMPLAMTLVILWKIKEVIFTSIVEAEP